MHIKGDPSTLEEAVDCLYKSIDAKEMDEIKRQNLKLYSMHFGLGTTIRNMWLWDNPKEGNTKKLAEHFRKRFGLGHADDMSGLILYGVDSKIAGIDPIYDDLVATYKKHWADMKVDPMTNEKVE